MGGVGDGPDENGEREAWRSGRLQTDLAYWRQVEAAKKLMTIADFLLDQMTRRIGYEKRL